MAHKRNVDSGRRSLIAGVVAAGVSSLLGRTLRAAESAATSLPLITRPIPSSGESLPAIGIGTDSFSESARDAIQAELGRMAELGGTVIDTAAAYGDSEALIGDALAHLGTRARMFLATKLVADGGAESFTRSLERLKTDHVDLLQVDYSIATREAAATLLPLAAERRIAVLVNLPFGRSSLFREAAGRPLPPWAGDIDVKSWAQYFLKYVISHPAVTCAIPGSTQVSHLIDNQDAGRGRLPDESLRRRMEEYWDHKSA